MIRKRCKRCNKLSESVRWSKMFKGFVCFDREKCTNNMKAISKPALTAEDAKVLARYLNGWADCDKHPESSENGKITKYYEGYQQAVRDIIQKIGWERFEGWCGYDSKRKVQNKPTRKV